MYIVGTAGHIDHGKTSLISALSGINCDTLPEEKKRGMTIDIGFSHIDYPDLGVVSIIDVPGHERFIRNMVVGAWGMDLALLVVASDDGWMPQTEDHFRVLNLLDIKKLIVVINKSDLVEKEEIDKIKKSIKEKLINSKFADSQIIEVSATKLINISKLKNLIYENIKQIKTIHNTDKPYLFIDRVFSPKGAGTVVTGTLKNGFLNDGEEITILPNQKKVKIKKIESHYKTLNKSSISQRTALNLANIQASQLKRGDIITRKSFFTKTNELIAEINIIDKNKKIKNNMELEILIGTTTVKGKLILLENKIPKKRDAIYGRLKFDNYNFVYPNEPFIITNPGGYNVIGGGTILVTNYKKDSRKDYKKLFSNYNKTNIENIIFTNIFLSKIVETDKFINSFKESNKQIENIIDNLSEKKEIIKTTNYLISTEYYSNLKKRILEIYQDNNKTEINSLSNTLNIKIEILKELINFNEKIKKLFEKKEVKINIDQKQLLKTILDNNNLGIETNKIKDKRIKNDLKELLNLKLVVSLDGNIYYHQEIYNTLCKKVINFIDENRKLSITEAREITNLSRKYIIPLLNRMERDFLIKRDGDFRVKI